MRAAQIAQMGTPRQLYEEPDNVFVATFMGEANHVMGTLDATDAEHGLVSLDTLKIALRHRNLPTGPVDVVIRPEAIRLVDVETRGCLTATVRTATYMGAHAEYNLDTPVGPLFAIAPEANALRKVGEAVGVTLSERGVFAVKSDPAAEAR
jgi:iron(III) transport system ATP-binding protein